MKTKLSLCLMILLAALSLGAQTAPAPATQPMPAMSPLPPMAHGPGGPGVMMYRKEMGKWWRNSDVAKKLQLSDAQLAQLDDTFYQHRLKLIDYGAEMEKQDLKLQTLVDADVPNEGQVESQVDQVLAARGKLEREYTMMNLDLRKVLSLEQWRQLKSIQGTHRDNVFFQRRLPAPPPGAPEAPLPPGGAPPAPDETF